MAIYFPPPLKTKLKTPAINPPAHFYSTAMCDRPLQLVQLCEDENTLNAMDNNLTCKASKFGLLHRRETKMLNYKGQRENYLGYFCPK